ncbi:nickel transporter permease [Candidatus Avoscillospira sp. LCP25S3_F1]|uniref:nickel transporter permease n=1 Tax=Candidatus Avoscillospira sp. LCP25S3_F1 TaxID=3438825 RepID=UPI003F8E700E
MTAAKKRFMIFGLMAMAMILVAILAPILATHDPNSSVLADAVQSPSKEHWFGTDKMGRDLFSRVIYGTRTSILSTMVLVLSILFVGGILGIVAGYAGGVVETVIMRVADMMVSFPGMALAIALAGMLGGSMTSAILAIMAVSWTKYARLARSLVLKVKHQDYVLAARISGTRRRDILLRYMVPSALPTLVITAATDVGGMMLELAGFSFLGLGAQSTSIEWGYMLNEGRAYMESAPWLMVFPGLAIFLTVMIFNLLGDSLRDILDPRADETHPNSKSKKRGNKMKRLNHNPAKVGALLVGAMLLSGVLTGCGSDSAAEKTEQNHLNFGCYSYSDSLDPITTVNSSWAGMRYGILECLFRFDDQVVAQPWLCDTYEVSDDYTTWTLHIRENVKFSNGNPVTPSAVQAALERLYAETDADRGGTGNSNPEVYLPEPELTADDSAGTLTVVCQRPTGNLPGILAYPYFSVIDVSVVEQGIVSTGPYQLDSMQAGVGAELSRNEYYWNGEVPYDTVSILFIEDSATKAMALQSGDVDLVENITTASDLEKLEADERFYVSTAAGVRTGNSYMNFNGPLGNAALRQAILMALDHETMCNVTVAGMYTPGFAALPSSLAYNYDQLTNPYSYNVEKAKETLDNAGIVDMDGDGIRELDGENLNLVYLAYTSRNLNDFAQAIALQLEEIGIGVTLNVSDYDTITALQNAGEFDLVTANTTTVGTGDPQDFLGGWYSGNSQNYGYYHNEEYDACFEELEVTTDQARRLELITQMQQILIDDAATIIHGYYNSRMISWSDRVTGAEIATIDYYWLTSDIAPAAEEPGNA